jgi:hypothetical protein
MPAPVRGRGREYQVSFKELLDSWRENAAAPRASKVCEVHLPVDDAARLAALAEMFPGRAPEQLITELLGVALREVAAAMPYVAGQRVISTDEQGDPVYEDVGPTPRFIELARRHRKRLEPTPQPATPPAHQSAAPQPVRQGAARQPPGRPKRARKPRRRT